MTQEKKKQTEANPQRGYYEVQCGKPSPSDGMVRNRDARVEASLIRKRGYCRNDEENVKNLKT